MSAKLRLFRERNANSVWIIFWLALLVTLAVAGAWLGISFQRTQSAYPGLSPNIPLAADKSLGVNADLTRYPPQELDKTLTQMRGLGLSWIRQPFPWSEIEPAPGRFNWTAWDHVVEAASAHNLQLIAVLNTTPQWARPPDTSPFTPPTELADFGDFAYALADRYHEQLDHYQVWDEPNLSAHWGDRFVDPAAYARLLREAAINLRAGDADALVLAAALAPTVETGPLNLNESDFLAGLYAANAARWFDVVSAQPYGFEQNPNAIPHPNQLNFARVELLRYAMVAHGDGNKPVWATAFGWSALPEGWTGKFSPWPSLPPDQQQTYTSQAILHARANWPWLGPILFATWDADTLPADDPRQGLALVDGETLLGQARAINAASLSENTTQSSLSADPRVASVGTYPAHHPSGNYGGDWRLSSAGADVPRNSPATLSIPFEGTRLDLIVRRGAFRGFLYVTIDGQPANALPQQAGRAYLVLYDPLEQEAVITLGRHLPDGHHIAHIEAQGGWYQWPIVGWRVSREGDTRAIQFGLALVGGLGIGSVIVLASSLRRLHLYKIRQWANTLETGYRELGSMINLILLAGSALAFFFAPSTLVSLGLLGLLFLTILPRPDLGLASVAFSLPFFLIPKTLVGRTISMTEVLLVLVALACVTRRTLTLLNHSGVLHTAPESTRPKCHLLWLDWASWVLTGIALLAGLLTLIPPANLGRLAGADWPVLTLMLIPLAGVLALLAQGWQSRPPVSRQILSLDMSVLALVGLALVATLAAQNFGVSLQEFHVVVWDGAAFYALIRLVQGQDKEAQGAVVAVPGLVWSLIDAFLLGTTLMALYAIYQFFSTDQIITAEGVRRAAGVYGSPNNLALLLDRAAPILIAFLIASQNTPSETGKARHQLTHRRRLLYGLALIPTLAGLALSFSRGALVLGLPAAILFIGMVRGGRVIWAALGALAVAGAGLFPLLGTDRIRSILDISAGTGFFRLRLWQSAWAMLRDFPWLGVGLDNFLYAYRTRYLLPDAWQEPNLSHPHNILLDFGTRLGVGGVGLLLWIQIAFWRVAWQLYRRQTGGVQETLFLGLMGSMVATLAHGLVDNSFFLVDLAFIFYLTLGIVARFQAGQR